MICAPLHWPAGFLTMLICIVENASLFQFTRQRVRMRTVSKGDCRSANTTLYLFPLGENTHLTFPVWGAPPHRLKKIPRVWGIFEQQSNVLMILSHYKISLEELYVKCKNITGHEFIIFFMIFLFSGARQII